MMIHSDKLKELRTHRGWTQQQLADLADLSLRTIQRIEKTGLIGHESLGALCSVFEIDNSQLLKTEAMNTRSSNNEMPKRSYWTHILSMALGGLMGALITVSFLDKLS